MIFELVKNLIVKARVKMKLNLPLAVPSMFGPISSLTTVFISGSGGSSGRFTGLSAVPSHL